MVSEGECQSRADANWTLAQRLAADGEYGWATTVTFYAAVHLVNILMVHAGAYSDDLDHTKREGFLRTHHPAIESRYSAMLSKSKRCRYEAWFAADEGYYRFQVKHLDEVRDYIRRFLAGLIPGRQP